jgi:hypothetical protein
MILSLEELKVKQRLVFCTPGNAGDADVRRLRQSSVLPMPLAEGL